MIETGFHIERSARVARMVTCRAPVCVAAKRLACVMACWVLWAGVTDAGAQPMNVVVRTVDEEALAGRLVSFSLGDGLNLEIAGVVGVRRIDAVDVVRITTTSKAAGPSSGAFVATLGGASGADRIVGVPGVFADERVTMDVVSLGKVRVPLERVAIWRNPQIGDGRWDQEFGAFVAAESNGADRLLLTNGDRVRGVVMAVDWEGFRMESAEGAASRFAHDRVLAASIVHVPFDGGDDLRARVELLDGTRMTASSLDWRDRKVKATILDGVELEIAADRILRIDMLGGRWRWLTELSPIRREQSPMMNVHWPMRVDRNVLGGPLSSAGRVFDRGIGVHSRSRLTYDLRGVYREFVTSYGMDDDSGPLADVTVNIRVDGEVRHERESVRRGSLLGPVRIDVRRADRIELTVDFGRLGGIQDRFDWIEPAVVR